MLGAIAGDIIGSRYERPWRNIKTKEFPLFEPTCHPTDDSCMTLALAQAILDCGGDWTNLSERAVFQMRRLGEKYPHGYGARFWQWLTSPEPAPYNSFGNGAAMRVSACAWAGRTAEEALMLSDLVTQVTHNHPEGMKGARAVTEAVFWARNGASKEDIRDIVVRKYYPIDFTLEDIRPIYRFDVTCQGSVPQALQAFFESVSFEDAIRNAVSIGGDSDTIAAIAGSVAEAFYSIPDDIREMTLFYLDKTQKAIVAAFEAKYGLPFAPGVSGAKAPDFKSTAAARTSRG